MACCRLGLEADQVKAAALQQLRRIQEEAGEKPPLLQRPSLPVQVCIKLLPVPGVPCSTATAFPA